jgi:hypothetical protein
MSIATRVTGWKLVSATRESAKRCRSVFGSPPKNHGTATARRSVAASGHPPPASENKPETSDETNDETRGQQRRRMRFRTLRSLRPSVHAPAKTFTLNENNPAKLPGYSHEFPVKQT